MAKYRVQHPRGELVEGYPIGKHPLYHVFTNMLDRCLNTTSKHYPGWGGKGITVCSRWRDFRLFVADMGPRSTPYHTLERKKNVGNYTPSNCVWATRTTQAINRRRFESNTTGATGVVNVRGRFHARFDFEHKRYDLGRYKTLHDASLVRASFVEGFLAARGGLHA